MMDATTTRSSTKRLASQLLGRVREYVQPGFDNVIDQLEHMGREFHGRLVALEVERDRLQQRVADLEATQLQYRGVWVEGEQYEAGDLVTNNGLLWFCHSATTARPGTNTGGEAWQMMHKSGGR